MSVENRDFSTFSTGFSTRPFHSPHAPEYAHSVYIIIFRLPNSFPTFWSFAIFTTAENFPKNSGLDRLSLLKKEAPSEKMWIFFKKGIDFMKKTRYNRKLYEHLLKEV